MDGIEKITAKIAADAEADVTRILAETEEKVRAIGQEAQAQAEKERADILNRGQKAADERLERLQSASQMEKRKLILGAKQEVVGEAFDLALEKLCQLPDKQLVDLLAALAVEASSTGREALVFSVRDRARIGKQVVMAANEALVRDVKPELPNSFAETKMGAILDKVVQSTTAMVTGTGLLTLSEETRPIQGGFVMLNGDIEINCTFETLVRMQRESLERDVAKKLFD